MPSSMMRGNGEIEEEASPFLYEVTLHCHEVSVMETTNACIIWMVLLTSICARGTSCTSLELVHESLAVRLIHRKA
jgi:hypothetical protein